MKLNLTKEQYKRLIKESIDNAIVLNEGPNDRFIRGFKDSITKNIQSRMNNDAGFRGQADELGINYDYEPENRANYLDQIRNKKTGKYNPFVNDEVRAVVNILKGVTNSTGGINFKVLKANADAGNYKVDENHPLSYSRILRIKDFIDSMSLRHLYDNSVAPSEHTKFGLQPPSELTKMGDEAKKEYDPARDPKFFDINNVTQDMLDYANKNEKKSSQLTMPKFKAKILNKYLQSAYGIGFNAPSFELGNKKVVGALMINFTSAFKCPAWNECLVKHACYARAGEVRHYDNTKTSNDRKNLMWLAADADPKMMDLVYDLLKSYVVSWTQVETKLNKSPELFNSIGNDMDKLATMKFSEMPEGVIDIIKKCKRVSYIRLNENGDFINDNILKSVDKMAEDFKVIDVHTAAYSCRNLNFENVKNIIINASRSEMRGPTIQRYFFAIPVKMYEAFKDTYTSNSMSNSFDSIGKVPAPLYYVDENGNKTPNGSYYYKCPCSRKDFTLVGDDGETKPNSEVNCYQCHLCYEKNDPSWVEKLGPNGKLYVFVKAHGMFANLLDAERERDIIEKVGVPENYQLGLRDNGTEFKDQDTEDSLQQNESRRNGSKQLITEQKSMQNEAFQVITENAVYSMTQHFKEMGINESKIKKISQGFSKTMNLINEADKKRFNNIID